MKLQKCNIGQFLKKSSLKIVCSGDVSKINDIDENNDFFNKIGLFSKLERRTQDVYSCSEHKNHLISSFKTKYIFHATCMGIHHSGGRRITKTSDRRTVTLKKSKELKYYLDELLPCDSFVCVTCNFRCDRDLKKKKNEAATAAAAAMEIDSPDDDEDMDKDEDFHPDHPDNNPKKKDKPDESGFVEDMDESGTETKDPELELLKELATINGFMVILLVQSLETM